MTTFSDDALQRRIARFVGEVRVAKAINSDFNVCLGTSLGAVRKENQDRALVVWASYAENPDRNFALAVLSDGMGGLTNGDEAATTAVSVFVSRVLRTPRLAIAERLENAARHSNRAVYDRFGGRGGATLSAVFIGKSGRAVGVNVGDSRIYAVTDGKELIQLSRDDTLAGVLGEGHPSNENRNRLVQFMGMGEGIEPNIVDAGRHENKTLLITSDGIHGSPISALKQIVRRANSEIDMTRKLLSLSELLGGQDNGTVITFGSGIYRVHDQGDQGLSLKFLSVNDHLEVWIPILGDDARQDRPRIAEMDKVQTTRPNESDTAHSGEKLASAATKKKRRSAGRSKRIAKEAVNQEKGLPLDDTSSAVLNIKFPPSE